MTTTLRHTTNRQERRDTARARERLAAQDYREQLGALPLALLAARKALIIKRWEGRTQ